jgi:biopolymer transport protein ExbD
MPVKLNAKILPENAEARIEIVPLIDIMFFLLVSFMLVSMSMVNLKGMKVNLPTAVTASPDTRKDLVDISVDRNGFIFLDKNPVGANELIGVLADLFKKNPDLHVFVSGDRDARHGDMIRVLDALRRAGIDKVAFEIRPAAEAPNP